jgi:superfamily II DNA/RNA helicase
VIILADTRPLIKQITKIANTLKETVYDDIIIEGVFGGQQFSSNGCHILITTNGNLKNSIQKFIHTSVKLLIIDEADVVMKSDFSNVFLPQLIIKVLNPACKLLLTTATSTDISKNFLNKI